MELTGLSAPVMKWEASNLPEQWNKFQRHVELMFKGPLKAKTGEEKVSYLLIWVGDKGRDIFATWEPLTGDDAKNPDKYYEKFKGHIQPSLNPVFARYKLNNEIQGSDSIDKFVTRLRLSAVDCNFGDKDEMIRDRIVFGTNSSKIREKLINKGEGLTLQNAIQIAQSHEYSQQQLNSMAASNDVHSIRPKTFAKRKPLANGQNRQSTHRGDRKKTSRETCQRCGYQKHEPKTKCPAMNETCYNCDKMGHFSNMCKSKTKAKQKPKTVHNVYNDGCNSSSDEEF